MMNVDIMRKQWNAHDNGEPTIGNKLIDRWFHDKESLKMGRSSANFIYFYRENNIPRVLRIVPESERTEDLILAELDFMDHLRKDNIPAVEVLLSKNNKRVEKAETDDGNFLGVAFEYAPGKWYETEEMGEARFIEWGKIMARIHNSSETFKAHSGRRRRTWKEDIELALSWLEEEDQELRPMFLEFLGWLEVLPKDENYGLIHYDLGYDNIIWNNGSYKIIDFDDAAYYPFVADIAFAIDEVRDQEPAVGAKWLEWFTNGYTSIRHLPDSWENQLQQFFILIDLLKYGRLRHSYSKTNPELDPPWLAQLRKRHMNSLKETKRKLLKN